MLTLQDYFNLFFLSSLYKELFIMSTQNYLPCRKTQIDLLAKLLQREECNEIFASPKDLARYLAKVICRDFNFSGIGMDIPRRQVELNVLGVRFASILNSTTLFDGDHFIDKLKQYFNIRVNAVYGQYKQEEIIDFYQDFDFKKKPNELAENELHFLFELKTLLLTCFVSTDISELLYSIGKQQNPQQGYF